MQVRATSPGLFSFPSTSVRLVLEGIPPQTASPTDSVAVTPPVQADLAWALGADVVTPEGADPTQTIQAVRHLFGGGVDNAIHLVGDISVAAGVVRQGGKFTSVTLSATQTTHSDADYFPTTVVPSGHKLADLLFKVAAHRLHSFVGRTYSFDQVCDAVNPDRGDVAGRTVVMR
jgi:NADPH:quinone reductase-like Zn-dependent oxidoreductase